MTKKPGLGRVELYQELKRWNLSAHDPGANKLVEDELWKKLGRKRAVLISDLSGFTRITRSKGILHFLAIFERAHEIGEVVFARHGGRFLKTQADNLFALFDTVGAAAACAQAMLHEADKLNAQVPLADGHVRFCVGIGFGEILELADDAFGDQVNVAFKLGEDIAEPGQILISEPAAADLRLSLAQKDLATQLHDPTTVEVGHVELLYWHLPPLKG